MFYTKSGRTFLVTTSETRLVDFLLKLNPPSYLCRKISAEDANPSGMVVKLVLTSAEHSAKLEALLNNYPNG